MFIENGIKTLIDHYDFYMYHLDRSVTIQPLYLDDNKTIRINFNSFNLQNRNSFSLDLEIKDNDQWIPELHYTINYDKLDLFKSKINIVCNQLSKQINIFHDEIIFDWNISTWDIPDELDDIKRYLRKKLNFTEKYYILKMLKIISNPTYNFMYDNVSKGNFDNLVDYLTDSTEYHSI